MSMTSTNSNNALAPIYTLVRPALVTGFKQPLQMNDRQIHHKERFTNHNNNHTYHQKPFELAQCLQDSYQDVQELTANTKAIKHTAEC